MLPSHRFALIVGVAFSSLLFLLYHSFSNDVHSFKDITSIRCKAPQTPTVRDSLRALFDHVRHPITEDYVDSAGKVYRLRPHPHWTQDLGKRVLIVDIDTRVPNGTNELLAPKKMNWEEFDLEGSGTKLVSNGIMTHYLYAQIHGYDYKYFQAQHIEGLYDTWIRPHILRSLLPDYDFVITMDADVTVTHPEVPFEWLFNHWNITNRTSISLPWDVYEERDGEPMSYDSKGVQVFNAGFVIVQNQENGFTEKMLKTWGECPTEKVYEGCAHWKEEWSHEQRAFSEYIRYDFNPDGDNIVPIPCDDAMSWPTAAEEYPGRIISNCQGNFFRHHTLKKQAPKQGFTDGVMQLVTQLLQKSFRENEDHIWFKEPKANTTKVEDKKEEGETELETKEPADEE